MTASCPRCQGIGFTRWGTFVASLGSLLAGLWGEALDPPRCGRCRGSGLADLTRWTRHSLPAERAQSFALYCGLIGYRTRLGGLACDGRRDVWVSDEPEVS